MAITENYENLLSNDLNELKGSEELFSKEDMVKIIKAYTEENIPQDMLQEEPYKSMWAILGKTPVLTFLDKEDINTYESLFRIAKINHIISMPAFQYSAQDRTRMNQLRIYFLLSLKRAVGHDKNKVNERTMEATSINQVVRSNTEQFGSGQGGVLSKFKGLI